jgi:outer membrane protein OmpA-like peptidoglycan-associated protein
MGLERLNITDRSGAEELLGLAALDATGVVVSTAPLALAADRVSLLGLESNIRRGPDGQINLNTVLPESGSGDESPAAEMPLVRIGTVRLQEGRLQFTDETVEPVHSTAITNLDVTLAGLATPSAGPLGVQASGNVNEFAKFDISGDVDPLAESLFLDMSARLTGYSLPPISPYAEQAIGYRLAQGDIGLDLKYHVENNELRSENKARIDRLALGEKVEGGGIGNLPIKLAIPLLKNRNDEIHLSIPVSGRLDDPSFSVTRVIAGFLQSLVNKAATAHFTLLAQLVGTGEDLSHVTFAPGSSEIGDPQRRKLDMLAKVLYERPALQLTITGHADRESDPLPLRRQALMQRLKRDKLNSLPTDDRPEGGADAIELSPADRCKFILLAFRNDGHARMLPWESDGSPPSIPRMEVLLLSRIAVPDGDLAALARRRADAVRDYLLKTERVETERVSVAEPAKWADSPGKGRQQRCAAFERR